MIAETRLKTSSNPTADNMLRVCRDVEILTGQDPHVYTSAATVSTLRIVFQDGTVALSYAAGLAHAKEVYADAYRAYTADFGPFDAEATSQVSMWICSDGRYYEQARTAARRGVVQLGNLLTYIIKGAVPEEAAGHVRSHLSEAELARVEWASVASDLLGE